MLIQHMCSVALYCQSCGQVQIQDVPYFSGKGTIKLKCHNCSHELANIKIIPKRGIILDVACSSCHSHTMVHYSLANLKKISFEKIYCNEDMFELGYIGNWQAIAEFLDFNEAEYDSLHPEEGTGSFVREQLLLAALNKIHDLAEAKEIVCPCGSHSFRAMLNDNTILIECTECGSYSVIPVDCVEDIQKLSSGYDMDFILPGIMEK